MKLFILPVLCYVASIVAFVESGALGKESIFLAGSVLFSGATIAAVLSLRNKNG